MVEGLDEIRSKLKEMLPDLAAKYRVKRMWVFGSLVRGDHGPSSDVDVLVEFSDRDFSLLDFVALEQEMSERLGYKVDLVDRSAVREELKPYILPEAVAV